MALGYSFRKNVQWVDISYDLEPCRVLHTVEEARHKLGSTFGLAYELVGEIEAQDSQGYSRGDWVSPGSVPTTYAVVVHLVERGGWDDRGNAVTRYVRELGWAEAGVAQQAGWQWQKDGGFCELRSSTWLARLPAAEGA